MKAEEMRADYTVGATGQRDWPVMAIEAITDVNPRVDKAAIPDDLPVSFVPMPAVGAGNGSIYVEETRPAAEVKKGFTAFLEGDVLFAKITPCMENGKMAVVPKLVNGYGFGSTEFHVLRPKPGMDAKYLYYYVSSQAFRSEAERYMTGAVGQKRVSTTYLKQSTIPVAPLDQQKRIVAEIEKQFSRLDEAVANLERVKANFKRYKSAVLKAAVEGKLTEAWRKQHPDTEPASKLLQRNLAERRAKWEQAELAKMQAKGKIPKDDAWKKKYPELATPDTSDLPEIPEGWQWVSWEKVLDFEVGAFKRGPFGSALTKAIFVESGYKVYEQYCPINDDPSFARYFVTEKKYKEMEGFAVKAGDFLISCSGVTLGRITQIPENYEHGIINQALLRVRLNNSLIDDGYFLRLFRSPYFQKRIFDNSQGAAIPNVKGVKELKAIPIPLPPIDEQMALSSLIDEQMSIIANAGLQVDANVKRAARLRQSTLSRAFSGLAYMNEQHSNKASSNGRQC